MGDTLDFPAFPGQPELDGMDRAQLLSCLEQIGRASCRERV